MAAVSTRPWDADSRIRGKAASKVEMAQRNSSRSIPHGQQGGLGLMPASARNSHTEFLPTILTGSGSTLAESSMVGCVLVGRSRLRASDSDSTTPEAPFRALPGLRFSSCTKAAHAFPRADAAHSIGPRAVGTRAVLTRALLPARALFLARAHGRRSPGTWAARQRRHALACRRCHAHAAPAYPSPKRSPKRIWSRRAVMVVFFPGRLSRSGGPRP
jgi:hypothetical protein